MDVRDEVRRLVVKHLRSLRADLDQFEQTTHGRIDLGDDLIDALRAMYEQPRAYTISDFCQAVDNHAKQSD